MTARPGTGRRALLAAATARLAAAGVASPGHDAAELLAHVLGTTRGRLVLVDEVDAARAAAYDGLVTRRAAREPLQHLTGLAHFRHVELRVGPGVFVPRPETELLAGWAVEEAGRVLAAGRAPVVVDLCTGSGAIARALVDEVPVSVVHAVELSQDAAAWAAQNVERAGVALDLRLGDAATAFADLDGAVDVVVSNPPYIPPGSEPTDPEVRDHDPQVALYGGGPDGLGVPAQVATTAARLLRSSGLFVMEHADVQQPQAVRLLQQARGPAGPLWSDVVGHADLTGRPRFVTARRAAR